MSCKRLRWVLDADTMGSITNQYPSSKCNPNSTTRYRGPKNRWTSSWHTKSPKDRRGISVACGKRWPRAVRWCKRHLQQLLLNKPESLTSVCKILISQKLVPALSVIQTSVITPNNALENRSTYEEPKKNIVGR